MILTEKTIKKYTGKGSGFYCSSLLTKESEANLIKWIQDKLYLGKYSPEDLFIEKEEVHCTIIYSPKNKPAELNIDTDIISSVGYALDVFGKDNDCLVLRIYSNKLTNRNKKWIKLGCVPTFNPYKAHITLSNQLTMDMIDSKFISDLKSINKELKNKNLKLFFDKEIIEDLNKD